MTDHEHDEEPHGFAFAFPVPEAVRSAHERHRMEAEDLSARAYRLVDTLTPDQLIGLRFILNQDSESAMNNYWDGRVVAILRRVHGVDPLTGLTPLETLERAGGAS